MSLLQWENQMDMRDIGLGPTVQHNLLVLFLVDGTCSKQVKIMDFFFWLDCFIELFHDISKIDSVAYDY